MKIYILLSHTGTLLSKIIRFYTKKEYSHVSISMDKNLRRLYSFGRLHPRIAFIGGFVQEDPEYGTFKLFKNTYSSLYELEVSEEQYYKIESIIDDVEANAKEYKFNLLGLAMVPIKKKRQKEKYYYCAEFVKEAMEEAGIDVSNLPDIIKPEDFKKVNGMKKIYTGFLRDYRKQSITI